VACAYPERSCQPSTTSAGRNCGKATVHATSRWGHRPCRSEDRQNRQANAAAECSPGMHSRSRTTNQIPETCVDNQFRAGGGLHRPSLNAITCGNMCEVDSLLPAFVVLCEGCPSDQGRRQMVQPGEGVRICHARCRWQGCVRSHQGRRGVGPRVIAGRPACPVDRRKRIEGPVGPNGGAPSVGHGNNFNPTRRPLPSRWQPANGMGRRTRHGNARHAPTCPSVPRGSTHPNALHWDFGSRRHQAIQAIARGSSTGLNRTAHKPSMPGNHR
jgi:hypothetical protein